MDIKKYITKRRYVGQILLNIAITCLNTSVMHLKLTFPHEIMNYPVTFTDQKIQLYNKLRYIVQKTNNKLNTKT